MPLCSPIPAVPLRFRGQQRLLDGPGLILSLSTLLVACQPNPEARVYPFAIVANSGPGERLAGVQIAPPRGGTITTGADGVGQLKLSGKEGERIALKVACPAGYESPKAAIYALLTTHVDKTSPELAVHCPSRTHRLVVLVQTENAAGVPLEHHAKELLRTSAQGASHLVLEGPPGHEFVLALNTSEQPELQPSNPTARFSIGAHDDVAIWQQDFQRKVQKREVRVQKASVGPVRLR